MAIISYMNRNQKKETVLARRRFRDVREILWGWLLVGLSMCRWIMGGWGEKSGGKWKGFWWGSLKQKDNLRLFGNNWKIYKVVLINNSELRNKWQHIHMQALLLLGLVDQLLPSFKKYQLPTHSTQILPKTVNLVIFIPVPWILDDNFIVRSVQI